MCIAVKRAMRTIWPKRGRVSTRARVTYATLKNSWWGRQTLRDILDIVRLQPATTRPTQQRAALNETTAQTKT